MNSKRYQETVYISGNLRVIVDQNFFVVKSNSCNFISGYRTTLSRLIELRFSKSN